MEITTIVYGVMGICVALGLITIVMEYQDKKKAGQIQEDEVLVEEKTKETSTPRTKPQAKKATEFNPKAVDRDKDGIIQEGTKFERPVEKRTEAPRKAPTRRGRPKKGNGQKAAKTNGSNK